MLVVIGRSIPLIIVGSQRDIDLNRLEVLTVSILCAQYIEDTSIGFCLTRL